MHANYFCSVPEGTGNSATHARDCSTVGRKCTFLATSWDGFPIDLHNFWVEKLTATHICTNYGLTNPARENCAIFTVRVDCENCAIIEPNRLRVMIAQFLEGRLVSLQNCAIYWGSCSTCSWTKSG